MIIPLLRKHDDGQFRDSVLLRKNLVRFMTFKEVAGQACVCLLDYDSSFTIMTGYLARIFLMAISVNLFLACNPCGAQLSPCSRRTVWASVTDHVGAPIPGLQAVDFQGHYRGKSVQILHVSGDSQKRRVVIMLDASGSQGKDSAAPDLWGLGLKLASDLGARLEDTDLALVIFNEKIVEKLDFGSGRQKIAARLQQIAADPQYEKANVKGRTAIWDAAVVALDLLGSDGNGAIYAITDGVDNASKIKQSELRRRLVSGDTRFFSSLIMAPLGNRGRTPEEIEGPEGIWQMAAETGGAVFGPLLETTQGLAFGSGSGNSDGKTSIGTALARFYLSLLNGYRIEIELPATDVHWTQWKLDLTKLTRAQHKDFRLGYARDIPPCGANP